MNKFNIIFKILLVSFGLFKGCEKEPEPEPEHCVTCEKGGWTQTDRNTYEYFPKVEKKVCSEEERLRAIWHDNYRCPDNVYLGYNQEIDTSYTSYILKWTKPRNEEVYVDLDNRLHWSGIWSVQDGQYVGGVSGYTVYFGTNPDMQIVSENQTQKFFIVTLDLNTKYYWRVIMKFKNGERYASSINSFTTMPEIIYSTFTDSRDGRVYKTVSIENQIWMAENLAFEIPEKNITEDSTWSFNKNLDGWCYLNNDKNSHGSTYGILYQWEAAKAACPDGWHLPTMDEWDKLVNGTLGEFAHTKLRDAATGWFSTSILTNSTGFTALPGGSRDFNSDFLMYQGNWWTSSELDGEHAWSWKMKYDYIVTEDVRKGMGFSVRCIKDE